MPDDIKPAMPPSALWGGLRFVQPHRISGWAFAPKRPTEHLHVEIRLDGVLIATTEASVPFEHLERSGICAADHGFIAESESLLPVDAPERIEVIAVASTGDRVRLSLPGGGEDTTRKPAASARLVRFVATDRQQTPVFILGAARSGTSALGRALRRSLRYAGHGEGQLVKLLPRLTQAVAAHYQTEAQAASPGAFTMLAGVPAQVIEEGLRAMFVKLIRAQFPDGRWMDKTPGAEMIRAAPLLREVWPEARFVFLQRRGMENVVSRQHKFPEMSFETHCTAWAQAMEAWDTLQRGLPPACLLAIEQRDMATQPRAVADRLQAFLGLTPAEAGLIAVALETERPQQTNDRFAEVLDWDTTGWTAPEAATFTEICGPAMCRFGYTDDLRYRQVGL